MNPVDKIILAFISQGPTNLEAITLHIYGNKINLPNAWFDVAIDCVHRLLLTKKIKQAGPGVYEVCEGMNG